MNYYVVVDDDNGYRVVEQTKYEWETVWAVEALYKALREQGTRSGYIYIMCGLDDDPRSCSTLSRTPLNKEICDFIPFRDAEG